MFQLSSRAVRGARSASALVCAAVLAACANFDGIHATVSPLTAQQLALKAGTASEAPPLATDWWIAYGDPQLNDLVQQALAQHPSLHMAKARLDRAQALGDTAYALSRPTLNAGVDLNLQRYTANGMIPPPIAGTTRETGTLQATGSWELDFFGKHRAALESALGQVRAAQADAQAARMLLVTMVARNYFQWARLQAQLEVARRTLAQREQLLGLVQDRVRAGLDTQLEWEQSAGNLPEARLQIESLLEQIQLARNAIATLIAKPNEPLTLTPPAQAAITSVAIGSSLPIDLLSRRADIAAAKQRVLAATKDVENAKAQFYPNINLVAFAGWSSMGFDRLLEAGSQQWGVGPAIRLPLFDAGRLRAQLRGKTADLDAAIASYNSTVIEAIHEATDQLASAQAVRKQQAEQAQAQEKAQAAYDIARQRFEAGLATSLQVLSAETAVLAQRRQAIDLAARALDTQVLLSRALGGGYHDETLAAALP